MKKAGRFVLPFVLYHIAVCGDYSYCHGDIFAAVGDCFSYCVFYSATAWNFHSGYCYAADIVSFHYLAKLFGIVCGVKLRTAYDGYFACHEIGMEASAGIGCAICSDKQVCAVKLWCVHRYKLYLHRPLHKL